MAPKVVVTGANGHVGAALTRELLSHGYSVVATVRDKSDECKTAPIRSIATELGASERLTIESADLMANPDWSSILRGVDGLFAVAAVYATRSADPENEIVRPSTVGGINLLREAAKAKVPRVVYTSSVAAVGSLPEGRAKTEEDWNEDATLPYTKAKTDSERLAWRVAKETGLDLRVVNPSMVWGPDFARHTPSTEVAVKLLRGGYPAAPKSSFGVVDSRDVASLHRIVFERDDAEGRYICSGDHGSLVEIGRRFKESCPEAKPPKVTVPWIVVHAFALIDEIKAFFGFEGTLTQKVVRSLKRGDAWMDTSKARGLGWTPLPFETTVRDTVDWINAHDDL